MTSAFAAGIPLAADPPASSGGSSPVFLILIVVLAVVWIFMLRSNKRRKQTELAKREAIQPGSRVLLSGGLIGTLVSRSGDRANVELGPGVTVQVMSGGILRTVEDAAPGTDGEGPDQTGDAYGAYRGDDDDEDSTEPVDRGDDDEEDSTEPVDRGDDQSADTEPNPASGSAITESGRRSRQD